MTSLSLFDMALRSKLPDVKIPDNVSWPEYVFQNFDKYGDRTAIVDAISGRFYSYNQLTDLTRRLSSALFKRGFRKGDVMAIYLPNVIEYPIIFFGVAFLGGVCTTVNPFYSTEELARQLRTSGAKYIVTIPPLAENAKAAGALEGIRSVFVIGQAHGCVSLSSLLSDDGTEFPKNVGINPKEDLVLLPFSSGTTGLPKGVMLSHFNLIAGISLVFSNTVAFLHDLTYLNVAPFFSLYGLIFIMGVRLFQGCKIVVLQRFEPKTFLQTIQDNKVTNLSLVPPLVLFLAKHPLVDKFDLSSLKDIIYGAAPLGVDMEIAVKKRLNLGSVRQDYGMTESSGPTHFMVTDEKSKPGSVGVLLSNMECKVIGLGTGAILGPNQDGEICVRGPTVMKGYLNNPEATARTIDSDGWLHTGDIGHYDKDEYFYIVDRLKELIKYKAFQVPPAELEALLISHPNIDDVAVIGVPDVEAGELPRALVVRRGHVTSAQIKEFVSGRVAPHKKLRGGVEFVDKIPKSASGKILRRILREQHKKSKL